MPSLFDSIAASYSVRTHADPHVVGRLLDCFAAHELVPQSIRVRRFGHVLTVTIEQTGIDEPLAALIATRMRSVAAVEAVALECSIGATKERAA